MPSGSVFPLLPLWFFIRSCSPAVMPPPHWKIAAASAAAVAAAAVPSGLGSAAEVAAAAAEPVPRNHQLNTPREKNQREHNKKGGAPGEPGSAAVAVAVASEAVSHQRVAASASASAAGAPLQPARYSFPPILTKVRARTGVLGPGQTRHGVVN
jgi:hypothetical protein